MAATKAKTKTLPDAVAAAFAIIGEELPSTYPSRNPKWIYFLKQGHKPNEPLSGWNKYPFDDFAPYVEQTGIATSAAVYYRLRKEYQQGNKAGGFPTHPVSSEPADKEVFTWEAGSPAEQKEPNVRAHTKRPPNFQLQYDPAEIPKLAAEYMKVFATDDCEMEQAGRRIATGEFSRSNLKVICQWKSERRLDLLDANTDAQIERALRRAVSAKGAREAVESLTSLSGVAVRMASAVLTAIDSASYSVLDYRALEALGIEDAQNADYSVDLYISYLEACRSMAKRYGVTMRDFDRANWQWSKRQSGGSAATSSC